ncbi:hypothetical protein ACWEFL_26690 [Streptomyces sp. NPDC004838]
MDLRHGLGIRLAPGVLGECPVDAGEGAWTTPVPWHVSERHTPLRGEDTHLVRPYAPLDDTLRLRTVRPRPRRILVHMARGLDLAALPGAPG